MTHVIKLKILTPDKIALQEEVAEVVVPTEAGEITILPNHSPLVSIIKAGEVKFRKSGETALTPMVVASGIVEIRPASEKNKIPTEVIVLVSRSEKITDLDLYRAEEALARAQKAMEEKEGEEHFEQYQELIEKELNRIKVYKKYRS